MRKHRAEDRSAIAALKRKVASLERDAAFLQKREKSRLAKAPRAAAAEGVRSSPKWVARIPDRVTGGRRIPDMAVDSGRVQYLSQFADAVKDLAVRTRGVTAQVQRHYEAHDRGAVFALDSSDVRSGTLHNIGAVIVASLLFAESAVDLAQRGGLPPRLDLELADEDVGLILDGAVMPTLRWGTLYRWWNEYESGIRSVLRALAGDAPRLAKDIPAAVRAEGLLRDHGDWEAHFELCRTLRNLGHNADRLNPKYDRETRSWRGKTVRFEPGEFPDDLEAWPAWWHDTLLASAQLWAQIVIHDRVIAVESMVD
jgi:hypothetical protein